LLDRGGNALENNPFLALLLITGLALIVPVLASRFRRVRLPIVVGEIFAGILIGHSGFNLVEPSTTLTFLAEFGFAYLMFLSGLEIDFNLIFQTSHSGSRRTLSTHPLLVAGLILAGTLSLALLAAFGLSRFGIIQNPILMGVILSTTSLGIVVPVLKEQELLGSRYGQFLLVASSIADFVTLLLLTAAIAIRSSGLSLDLLLIPVLLLIFVVMARAGQQVGTLPILRRLINELSSATSQIRVRGAFALMVAWVVVAEALGAELILGAFLAGAIAGLITTHDDASAQDKLDAIGYGFFIPIFFIMVGVDFKLQVLFESPQALLLLPVLVIIAFLVKIVPSLILRLNFSWRETLAGGFLLSSRLSLIIAASSIALSIGAITEAVNSAIILLAVVSCTVSPLAFNRIYTKGKEIIRRGIIIVGKDQMAELLTERLLEIGERVTVICPDQSRLAAFQRLNIPIVAGCPNYVEAFNTAEANRARVLVDLTSSSEDTLRVCTLARQQFEIPLVVSRISDVELIPRLQELGVKVVQPALATAMALEGAFRYPTAFDVLFHHTEDVEVGEVGFNNKQLEGLPLRKVRLPGNALILSVQKGETVMVPQEDTVLELGDRIGLIGSPESLERAVALLLG
jgi:Kef-type K+ transport system membrane component KefB/Trk K+ transport system NAD-binding subunit